MLEIIITAALAAAGSVIVAIINGRRDSKAEAEKAVAEGRLASYVETGRVEAALRNIEGEDPQSPGEWNAGVGRTVPLLLAALLLTGCFGSRTVYIESRWPLLDLPDRPVLDESEPFSDRERQIVNYVGKLERTIIRYNEIAQERNAKHGFDD